MPQITKYRSPRKTNLHWYQYSKPVACHGQFGIVMAAASGVGLCVLSVSHGIMLTLSARKGATRVWYKWSCKLYL